MLNFRDSRAVSKILLRASYLIVAFLTLALSAQADSGGLKNADNNKNNKNNNNSIYNSYNSYNTVVYGIIPGMCGGFKGVAGRLDHIASLGANTIWLSPITDCPDGDFGYAVTDHYKVKPPLGSEDDLKELITLAHKKHLRVIFDIALNHLSEQHPFYKDTLKKGTDSKYWQYFDRDKNGAVSFYFDWRNLKNLNYANPQVRTYLKDSLKHWVKDFDVDGFRIDACWAVKDRAPDFWPQCLRDLRQIKPGLLMIAEASALDPYYKTAGFDAAYDWTGSPGKWTWAEPFDKNNPVPELQEALTKNNDTISVFRFLNNNDTGERFIKKHGEAFTRVAAAMLMTLPGVPCIYMGDECGADFLPYEEKQVFTESRNPDLKSFYEKLGKLRQDTPWISTANIEFLPTPTNSKLLAYWIKAKPSSISKSSDDPPPYNCAGRLTPDAPEILVILNFSAASLKMPLAKYFGQTNHCQNLISDTSSDLESTTYIKPYDVLILRFLPPS